MLYIDLYTYTSKFALFSFFKENKSEWCSPDGISKLFLSSIELHNLTYAEHKQLKHIALQRLQSSQYDLGIPIHAPKGNKKYEYDRF